jgi:hypothetical protein
LGGISDQTLSSIKWGFVNDCGVAVEAERGLFATPARDALVADRCETVFVNRVLAIVSSVARAARSFVARSKSEYTPFWGISEQPLIFGKERHKANSFD